MLLLFAGYKGIDRKIESFTKGNRRSRKGMCSKYW